MTSSQPRNALPNPAAPVPTEAAASAEDLFLQVYDQLRQIADRRLRERGDLSTLQPTAIVNEAYMRLCKDAHPWCSPDDFVRYAGRAIRNLVTDYGRRKRADKRRAPGHRVELDFVLEELSRRAIDPIELNEALERLAEADPPLAQLVELRFYAGQSWAECARLMGVGERQVYRWFRSARLFLRAELER